MADQSGQTHLNPNRERTLHDGAYLFPSYVGESMDQNVNLFLSGLRVKFQVMLAFVVESE
jgi:hypothetical protein